MTDVVVVVVVVVRHLLATVSASRQASSSRYRWTGEPVGIPTAASLNG